jgi:hypothetical protein
VAERSQILAIVNGSIIPQLCDPYERERARRKLEASPTALPMEVSPNARVNVPLSIGTMNRVLTQVARDLDQPWWKRDTKIADLLFRPEGGFTIELGAAQENLLMRPINAFRDPNLGGRAVLALYAPEIASLAQAGTRAETDYEAARTLLALDIYSRKHHSQWAGSLEALVKDGILRKVPIDPFSGKPLLYLPGKRIVYSVGPDAKDDGGNTKIFAGQGRDIAYWL